MKDVAEGLDRIDNSGFPGKLKAVVSAIWIISSVDVATVCV